MDVYGYVVPKKEAVAGAKARLPEWVVKTCERKVVFHWRKAAERALAVLVRSHPLDRDRLQVYECECCRKFHIGKAPLSHGKEYRG